ncbi:MAG: fimbria/pilus outer membrane usher protein [Desulfobacterales bacterium]
MCAAISKFFSLRIITIILLILLTAGAVQAEDPVILNVAVNGQDIGEAFLLLAQDGDVLVPPDFFSGLRLRKELLIPSESDRISLKSLSHAIDFAVDYDNAVLTMTVDPQWYESQLIRPQPYTPPNRDTGAKQHPSSGFLNYRIETGYSEREHFSDWGLPWEIGFNREKWFGFSNFRYRHRNGEDEHTRLMTSLIRDDPARLNRLTIGDFTPPATAFLSGGVLGGISWGTRFSLDRRFKPYPGLNAETVLETPAKAELYSSGTLIKEWDLLPGPVRFEDLNAFAGGSSELVLRDIFGKETRIDLPQLFGGRELLRKGIHEYSYSLGFMREDFGTQSMEYRDFSATAFHRYGFADRFSAGFGLAFQKELCNAGPILGLHLGTGHLISTEAMFSHHNSNSGCAVSTQYTYRKGSFAAGLSALLYSRDFQSALRSDAGEDEIQSLRFQWNLTASQSWQQWGGLSFSYVSSAYREKTEQEEHTSFATLSYAKNFFRHFSLSLSMKQGIEGSDKQEFFIGVQYTPSTASQKRFYDNMAYRYRDDGEENRTQELSVRKSTGLGKGFGYSLTVHQDGQETGGTGRAVYRHERGIAEASIQQSPKGSLSGNLGWAGGIGIIGSDICFGRPVIDSFAIVDVQGLDHVPVYAGTSLAGETGRNSRLMAPELISYAENRISIRPRDLPLDFELTGKDYMIEMGQRGGALIHFKAFRFTAVEGNLYALSSDGSREALSTLPVEYEVSGEKRKSFTGQNGYFYLENLPPGEYAIRVFASDGVCMAKILVPESGKIVSNAGDVVCEAVEE